MRFPPRFPSRFPPFIALCSAVLVASVLLPLPRNGAILNLPSPCPFFYFTAIPCPGCGLTRSFVCCGHGRLAEALVWHPLGPALFTATFIAVVSSLAGARFRFKRPELLIAMAVLVLGTFWVLRLRGVFPLPAA